VPFLASRPHAQPRAVIIGAPYDVTSSFRKGAREAPAAIRWASDSIETYSPTLDLDLEDLAFTDAGDLDLNACSGPDAVNRVADAITAQSGFPLVLGGEHTMTVGAVKAALARHPDLAVIAFDAHLDLRQEYDGTPWSHASTFARVLDLIPPDRLIILGARSGTRDEWTRAKSLLHVSRTEAPDATAWSELSRRPLYVTVDIDAFDPSIAPGTGNPEPLGLEVEDYVRMLDRLRDTTVVGADVVEVNPNYDPSGRTPILAAWLARDLLLAFAT
jgi:agmatinase